jgi:hypothetical protein
MGFNSWFKGLNVPSLLNQKQNTKIHSILLEVHIGGGGTIEPIGNAVFPAALDINNAVQFSVKYVTKVNGIPSSSNGSRYHRLPYTT